VKEFDQTDQIAALTASVTIKQIFAWMDQEGRLGFGVQGAQSDELAAGSALSRFPLEIVLEIVEEPDAPFEFIQAVAVQGGKNIGSGGRE
jgi:hypothetical protein